MNVRKVGLSYDDVLLVPKYSNVVSRSNVDLTTEVVAYRELNIPILSANMESVTGPAMACAMARAGGLGILHRFASKETFNDWMILMDASGYEFGISVGINVDSVKTKELVDTYRIVTVVLDVAHGDHAQVIDAAYRMVKAGINCVMAGNIVTSEAAFRLCDVGVSALKVGIGPGSRCTTRMETGHGYPQLTAIDNVATVADKYHVRVCADGGINEAGDIVKALGAGADTVMLGRLLAGADESAGDAFLTRQKVYRGSASAEAKRVSGMEVKHVEGFTQNVFRTGPVEKTIKELVEGIKSGLSYSGAMSIAEFQAKAEFIQVTPNDHHLKNKR